jgi:predicted acyltransferase
MATTNSSAATVTNPASAAAPSQRLLSLDVLRGITIAFMIMVNNNGGRGSWWFMNHAEWNGLTPTDLVFPTFVFVVGISLVFSTEARLARGASRKSLANHTIQRAAVLFVFGIVVNSFPLFELAHIRIYGVLQRIAICYLVVGLFYLWDNRASTKIAVLITALIGYWILLRWVPVPGAGMPGHDIPFLDKDQNLVAWLDRHILPYHLYEDWTTHNTRDPEGLLSDIPAIGTALIGVLAGIWLRGCQSIRTKAIGLLGATAGCLAVGYFWSIWFPLNKKLWTSSYVLVAAGFSLAVLTLAYFLVEIMGVGKTKSRWLVWPWLVFGSNAIAAYMFSELVPSALDNIHIVADGKRTNPIGWLFQRTLAYIPDPGWSTFAYSVSFCAICFIPVWILYRKKIFLKV